jgi:hypothetical protein
MGYSYVNIGTVAEGTGAITVPVPSGYTAGNLFILIQQCSISNGNMSSDTYNPSGWSRLVSSNTSDCGIVAYYKYVTSSESSVSCSDFGDLNIGVIIEVSSSAGWPSGRPPIATDYRSTGVGYGCSVSNSSKIMYRKDCFFIIAAGNAEDTTSTIFTTYNDQVSSQANETQRLYHQTGTGSGGGLIVYTADMDNSFEALLPEGYGNNSFDMASQTQDTVGITLTFEPLLVQEYVPEHSLVLVSPRSATSDCDMPVYYYYVKSGGTATGTGGRYTSIQTGSWFSSTTAYYGSWHSLMAEVAALSPHSVICFSNSGTIEETNLISTLSGNTRFLIGSPNLIQHKNLRLYSVSDSEMSSPATGAVLNFSETFTGESDYRYDVSILFSYAYGIEFRIGARSPEGTSSYTNININRDVITGDYRSNSCIYDTCTFRVNATTSSSRKAVIFGEEEQIFRSCNFVWTYTDYWIYMQFGNVYYGSAIDVYRSIGSCVQFINCNFTNNYLWQVGYGINALTYATGGCCTVTHTGSKFTNGTYIYDNKGALQIDRCYGTSSFLLYRSYDDTMAGPACVTIESGTTYSTSKNTMKSFTDIYDEVGGGDIGRNLNSSLSVYRVGGGVNLDGTPISYVYDTYVATGGDIYDRRPNEVAMRFTLAEVWLSLPVEKTLEVYLAQATGSASVKDTNMWLEFIVGAPYANLETSYSTEYRNYNPYLTNLLPSGTVYATDTSTWSGLTSPVVQKITGILPSTGGVSLVTVNLWIAANTVNARQTIYIDPVLGII